MRRMRALTRARLVARATIAAALVALPLLAACRIERDGTTGDSATASATARPAAADSTTGGGVATGPDTGIADARDDRPVDTTGAPSPVPTPDELAALARGLVVPVAGVAPDALPDNFAERRGDRPHEALDILAPRGTSVLSAADGRLLALHDSERGGLMVYAADPSGRFVLLYGHLDAYAPGLAEGMPLRRGQPLGTVGTTGNAAPDTPHLHFGIARVADTRQWWRGTAVDPRPLLAPPARAP